MVFDGTGGGGTWTETRKSIVAATLLAGWEIPKIPRWDACFLVSSGRRAGKADILRSEANPFVGMPV